MNTATLSSQPDGFSRVSKESVGQSIRRYSNLAATVALVFAIAAGGWFAMSQMPGGGSDGRFAAFQGTPEVAQSQKCDVEPLKVDEVMAIVENPYSSIDPTWFATPGPDPELQNREFVDLTFVEVMWQPAASTAGYFVPEQETFDRASRTADQILSCMVSGTTGQVWALTDPATIQRSVLRQFPIYRDAETVRRSMENLIDQPYDSFLGFETYFSTNSDLALKVNPRRGDARMRSMDFPEVLDYDKVMFIGWQATDAEGNVLFTDDWNATTVEGDSTRSNGTSFILVHSESDGQWYLYDLNSQRG